MFAICEALKKDADFQQVLNRIDGGGCPVVISGLSSIHKSHYIAAIRRFTRRPVFIIGADEQDARRTAGDAGAMCQEDVLILPDRDFTFYNAESVSRQSEHRRLEVMYAMSRGRAPIAAAGIDALLRRTVPPELLKGAAMEFRAGGEYNLEKVAGALVNAGYSRCQQVEGEGQFAIRGGILDFFSPAYRQPVRCEFFGDEIDSMGLFDVASQRRTEVLQASVILPAAETLPSLYAGGPEGLCQELEELLRRVKRRKAPKQELAENISGDIERLKNGRVFPAADRYMDMIYTGTATALDYIPPEAVVIISEPAQTAANAAGFRDRMDEDLKTLIESGVLDGSLCHMYKSWEDTLTGLEDFPVIMMDNFVSSSYPLTPRGLINVTAKRLPSYGGSVETAAGDIGHYINSGYSTVVFCPDERKAGILGGYLKEKGITAGLDFTLAQLPERGACAISTGSVSAGFEYPGLKLAVITEGQIVNNPYRRQRREKKGLTNRQKLSSCADLSPGDLVVHEYHGIGRFVGIFKMPVDGVEKDYVKIAYAGTDSLYVPATQLDLVQKYIGGGEDHQVRLSKMGGSDWQKTKSKAKGAAKEMAKDLIQLYAQRQRLEGYAFSPDTPWQEEFEAAFGYQETDDQLRCVEEIKADMEKPVPMDRLLCGDVGFGKTEVALRAVMKCVMDGKQAAILVPTTVLAQQHFMTVTNRFYGYPVRVEVLSRFRTPSQMKKTLKGVADGSVDIVIGTHRLIQKDVVFKDLGLLVVDEEQRFGVTHKERLKEISKQVDVLTLSATPIPRTLNMALSGIRDMSSIEEPPQDRQPVQTYVMEHDWGVLYDAIRREVARGGQVYYLHNRVENIEQTAARIQKALEGVTVGVAHGQMSEDELGSVMERVISGEVQVLVCTTIIETGIDIPNVNTLIIEDADRLGLAQLHQIRGRVGRSSRRAFAYLTFRQGKVLTEIAQKRLSAIREFAEFNSGFRIAMRDLEIRGAGNLLGAEQSGHMISVGYDMYLKLLEEAVLEEKGEKPELRTECSADLAVSANIPEKYIPSGEQRMDLYRRIAQIRTEEDADDVTDELIDRFGDPPKSVNALIQIALLRGNAANAGITEISQKSGWLTFKLRDFSIERISAVYARPEYKNRVKIGAGTEPNVALKLTGKNTLNEAFKFVETYKKAGESEKTVNNS